VGSATEAGPTRSSIRVAVASTSRDSASARRRRREANLRLRHGRLRRSQGQLGDQLTIAYDAASGLPAWKARLNDTGLDHDIGTVVHVTADGQRVITSGQFAHGGVDTSGRDNVYDVGTAAYLK
jgi:hypothetical protein